MSTPYAFVTLLTSDSYLPGALTVAGALKDVHQAQSSDSQVKYDTVCLVTPETLDVSTIKLLRRAFDAVIGVEIINQKDDKGLNLLGRPDLDTVLTKLHVFRLTQYSKIIFLDADVLPVRPLSHLFSLEHEFSAVPDVGWPDIFNSGVMVLSPGEDKFTDLRQLLKTRGSWDGGDQGVLNEWRGGDWNRLSFTYNTTPTAAYTYAPAYERFGSQISAIHFIGPNKPWHSIPYRAPGSSSETNSTDFTQQRAYDYGSLVDRWYAVYDRHYRSHTLFPDTEFEVRKYVSAWNQQSQQSPAVAEAPPSANLSSGGALGLDELRRLAIQGMGALEPRPEHHTGGEGGYKSLPLEGRFDLMRPPAKEARESPVTSVAELPDSRMEEHLPGEEEVKLQSESEPSTPIAQIATLPSGSPVRWATLPTPGVDEVPPAPHARIMSLPPTPLHYVPEPYKPTSIALPVTVIPDFPPVVESPTPERRVERPRPASPPLLSWNPAVEPPPKSTPTISAFPSNTYFPNVWDHTTSDTSAEYIASPRPSSHAFFHPPPVPEIPDILLRQGHYRNVTGPLHDDASGASPSPDRTKVKRVFPWEERPRHLPARVFPGDEPPPPGNIFLESSPRIEPSTPEKTAVRETPAMPSPLVGFPPSIQYANAWDHVPSIQKYASRLVRPPPQPLAPAFEDTSGDGRRSSRSWESRSEASSHDGDVEDETESEGEGYGREGGSKRGKRNSRSSSAARRRRTYRSVGVQTAPKEFHSQSVQAGVPAAVPKKVTRLRTSSLGTRRQWPPSTGSNLLPPVMAEEFILGPDPSSGMHSPALTLSTARLRPAGSRPGAGSPSGLSSPAALNSPLLESPVQVTLTTPKEEVTRLTSPPSGSSQQHTSDVSTGSPASSVGPVSPAELQPPTPPQGGPRKPGRVWDPARGVDLFKRGSEEVLARFLKMGSWEDQASQA
ncbi:hypothetical protein BV22DRAFT_1000595 [Leucogyrophana mollusca]|uniref:Uncharacterized protein n=1 Tax=Leucogyrophana mollusca TaxID=85980 RepID=A0ACB8BZ15_9AGAM|nr:hypothetical protein BV22DRAFT_1000595 [Leucogyrophana mollusca]